MQGICGMPVAGHMITLVNGRCPETYVVAEPDREKAIQILTGHLNNRSVRPLDPLPISAEGVRDYGVRPGQAKRLSLWSAAPG